MPLKCANRGVLYFRKKYKTKKSKNFYFLVDSNKWWH